METPEEFIEAPEDFLEHYGILGMRWGVRRTPEQLGRARIQRKKKGKPVTPTKAARKQASEDAAKATEALKKAKKGGVQTLSNKELKSLNERLNLEQNYNRLTSTDSAKSKFKSGKKFVDELISVGDTANKAYKLVNSPLLKDIRRTIDGRPPKKGITLTEPVAEQLQFDLGLGKTKKKKKKG